MLALTLALLSCTNESRPSLAIDEDLSHAIDDLEGLLWARAEALQKGNKVEAETLASRIEGALLKLETDWSLARQTLELRASELGFRPPPSAEWMREMEDEDLNQIAVELASCISRRKTAESEGRLVDVELLTYRIYDLQEAVEDHISGILEDRWNEEQEVRHLEGEWRDER